MIAGGCDCRLLDQFSIFYIMHESSLLFSTRRKWNQVIEDTILNGNRSNRQNLSNDNHNTKS